jgi:hypothetical protein
MHRIVADFRICLATLRALRRELRQQDLSTFSYSFKAVLRLRVEAGLRSRFTESDRRGRYRLRLPRPVSQNTTGHQPPVHVLPGHARPTSPVWYLDLALRKTRRALSRNACRSRRGSGRCHPRSVLAKGSSRPAPMGLYPSGKEANAVCDADPETCQATYANGGR